MAAEEEEFLVSNESMDEVFFNVESSWLNWVHVRVQVDTGCFSLLPYSLPDMELTDGERLRCACLSRFALDNVFNLLFSLAMFVESVLFDIMTSIWLFSVSFVVFSCE